MHRAVLQAEEACGEASHVARKVARSTGVRAARVHLSVQHVPHVLALCCAARCTAGRLHVCAPSTHARHLAARRLCVSVWPASGVCFWPAREGSSDRDGSSVLVACHASGEAEEYAVEDAPAFRIKTTVSCPRKDNLVKQPSALAPHTLPGSPPAEWEQWVWKSPHSGDMIASFSTGARAELSPRHSLSVPRSSSSSPPLSFSLPALRVHAIPRRCILPRARVHIHQR